ncbi:MAG TPA: hypothetical protein ENI72_01300 [Rhodospirillales bacterium]|nr:hypothetical protein [Rhodospirillales bacterium]
MTRDGKNNLIMSMAIGYDAERLRPFVFSLKESGFKGDTALIVSYPETGPETIKALESWGVTLVPYEGWRFMPTCLGVTRYIKYLEFLSAHGDDYERVLLTGAPNAVFRKDPFDVDLSAGLTFFTEGKTIGDDLALSQGIKSAFGPDALNSLHHKTVSRAGTAMGAQNRIVGYLIAMNQVIGMASPESLKANGMDRALHQLIVHEGIIKDFQLMEPQGGME